MLKIKKVLFFITALCFLNTGVAKEQALPDVQLKDFNSGEIIKLSDLKGKVLYLDFWASWCKPCKKSFPFMNELHNKYPADKFQVIAINMDEFTKDAQQFLSQLPAEFAIYTDPENTLAETLKLPGLPVAYVIDKQGNLKGRHIGFNERKKDKKIKQIEYLIGQP